MKAIKIESWIHAITVMAQVHGWYVMERDARAHAPSHICLKGGSVLVIFARPSGGKLMAQHEEPYQRWTQAETANPDLRCVVATPDSCGALWEVLTDRLSLDDLVDERR